MNQINGLFFNCAGVLQRDARPAGTVNGELSKTLPEGVDEKQIQVRVCIRRNNEMFFARHI